MDFSYEIRILRNFADSVEEFCDTLNKENLIKEVYGTDISDLMEAKERAMSELADIERNSEGDIDVDGCKAELRRVKEHLESLRSELEGAEVDLDDAIEYLQK